jgi:hypothetical protein
MSEQSQRRDVQARRGLGRRLKTTPDPTPAQLDAWAAKAAEQGHVPAATIKQWWRPLLQKRGLLPKLGFVH